MKQDLQSRLVELRLLREKQKKAARTPRPRSLAASERAEVLGKTGGKCHICGGEITGAWEADHVRAHSAGGRHAADNYLPAHRACNNYRWDYLPEEFLLILKLGVWVRTQIENGTPLGAEIDKRFSAHDAARDRRRKRP